MCNYTPIFLNFPLFQHPKAIKNKPTTKGVLKARKKDLSPFQGSRLWVDSYPGVIPPSVFLLPLRG